MKKARGQNLAEFGIILGVIAVVCIVTLTFFGENVKNLFVGSNQEYKKQTAFKWKEASANQFNQPKQYVSNTPAGYDPSIKIDKSDIIGSVQVFYQEDGSIKFLIDDQEVILSPDVQSLSEVAFETAGAPALTELVTEIQYMINKHKAEYPSGVPIEIGFGDSNRMGGAGGPNYVSTAEVNSFNVKVGNDIVIVAKDQDCTGNILLCSYEGTYRIEGTYDNSNNFQGTILSEDTGVGGTFDGPIDLTDGISLTDTKAALTKNALSWNFDWALNFKNDKSFDLGN